MAETAVVILNFNGENFLKQFLPGVIEHSSTADVIVADNCSTDGSIDYLTKHHSDVQLITLEENYGFTGGYNRVIKDLKHKYCVLLNSDVEVSANWLEPLVTFMEANKNVAACQPKILAYHQKDHFEYAGAAGGFIDALGFPYCRGRIFDTLEQDLGQYDTPLEIFWATGACMFVRVEDFNDADGFDEDFFAHMEEIDLCWRLQLMGKQLFCLPDSKVYHVGGGTLSKSNHRKTYYNFRNNLSMLFKNESMGQLFWKLPLKIVMDWMAALKFWKDTSFSHLWAVVRAHTYFISHIVQQIKKRRKVSFLKAHQPSIKPTGFITFSYFLKRKKHFNEL